MVGASRVRSGGGWAVVSGRIRGSRGARGREWLSGAICVSRGVRVGESGSEGRGGEGGGLTWAGE